MRIIQVHNFYTVTFSNKRVIESNRNKEINTISQTIFTLNCYVDRKNQEHTVEEALISRN